MRWIVLLVLSACATHDVLRAEPIVARAVCSGGLAVFGYDQDAPTCETEVESLGDGCYVAVRSDERPTRARQVMKVNGELVMWAPRLVECASNEVDGHIMCVEDELLPRRDEVFGEDISRMTRSVHLPYHDVNPAVTPSRCRQRFDTWELAHVEAPPSPELVTTYWNIHPAGTGDVGRSVSIKPLRFRVEEDAISLRRIIGEPQVFATVCPSHGEPRVEMHGRLPSRIAQSFASVFARAVIEGGLGSPVCARVSFGFTTRYPPAFNVEWPWISSRPLPLPR